MMPPQSWTDQRRLLESQRVHEVDDVASQQRPRNPGPGFVRGAKAAVVRCEHGVFVRQTGQLMTPGVGRFRKPMNEHDRRTGALLQVVHAQPCGADVLTLHTYVPRRPGDVNDSITNSLLVAPSSEAAIR